MMKTFKFCISALALAIAGTGSVQATNLLGSGTSSLVGVSQSFPSIALTDNYLIYDHNGVDSDTGFLRVVSFSSSLAEGAESGGSSQTQNYSLSVNASVPSITLRLMIANGTGRNPIGTFEGGSVSIGFGHNTTAARYAWTGNITSFGFLTNGTQFDATWTVTNDYYENMPSTLSQFVDGYLTGGIGGIKINNSTAVSSQTFNNDWAFGPNLSNSQAAINRYLQTLTLINGGLTNPIFTSSTAQIDVFAAPVPEPETYALMGLGLAMIAVRRKSSSY